MLHSLVNRACPSFLRLQPLQAALYSVQIVVPALGDSISDGEFRARMLAAAVGICDCWLGSEGVLDEL